MSLKSLVDEILAEHKPLLNVWEDVKRISESIKTEEPKTKEEKYNFLKPLTDLYGKSHEFMSRFKTHEIREERYIFSEMSERGKESIVIRLLDDHRKIDELVEDMRKLLENYRFEKISARELAEQMLKTHKKVEEIVIEHVEIEEREFPKLK